MPEKLQLFPVTLCPIYSIVLYISYRQSLFNNPFFSKCSTLCPSAHPLAHPATATPSPAALTLHQPLTALSHLATAICFPTSLILSCLRCAMSCQLCHCLLEVNKKLQRDPCLMVCSPCLTMVNGRTRIGTAKWCNHMISPFTTTSLSKGNSGPNCHHNLRLLVLNSFLIVNQEHWLCLVGDY